MLTGVMVALLVLVGVLAVANLRQDSASGQVGQLTATEDFGVYTLTRDNGADQGSTTGVDSILGSTVTGQSKSTVVYSAPRIQEFVALPGYLAVVTLGPGDTTGLTVVNLAEGSQTQVQLPGAGRVENLRGSTTGHLIAFSFTNADLPKGTWRSLYVLDVSDPLGTLREVHGLTGEPLSVSSLTFVPGTDSLVVQVDFQSLYLVTAAGTVSPLGQHPQLNGFIPGTARLVVSDRTTDTIVDLETGTSLAVDLRSSARTATSTAGQTLVLDPTGRYARVISEFDQGTENSIVTVTAGDTTTTLFQPDAGWARLGDLCTSPDGRYLAVETVATIAASDGYPNLPKFTPARTAIIDLTDGKTLRRLDGFLTSWCR